MVLADIRSDYFRLICELNPIDGTTFRSFSLYGEMLKEGDPVLLRIIDDGVIYNAVIKQVFSNGDGFIIERGAENREANEDFFSYAMRVMREENNNA